MGGVRDIVPKISDTRCYYVAVGIERRSLIPDVIMWLLGLREDL